MGRRVKKKAAKRSSAKAKKKVKKTVKKAVKKKAAKRKGRIAKKKTKKVVRKKVTKKTKRKAREKKATPKQQPLKTSTTNKFPIAIAQLNMSVGALDKNAEKIIATIQQAKDAGTKIIVFPELAITGYPPKDLLLRQDFIDVNLQKFIKIVNACRGITCMVGFANQVNGALHNAVAIIKDQKIIAIENKEKLPSHSYFDENKYFSEGKRADIITIDGKRLGIVLTPNLFAAKARIETLAEKGVDGIIAIGASPYAVRKPQEREQLAAHTAKKFDVPIIYCNNVGGQDGLVFDGNSFFVDAKGTIVRRAKPFSEEVLIVDLEGKEKAVTPTVNQTVEVYNALTLGIRDYFAKSGFAKAVIGVSGGIDSAVTLAIAVHALGPDNVTGVIMPSKVSGKETMADAKRICETLNIKYKRINIDNLCTATAKTVNLKFQKNDLSITEQNIQARVRAQILLTHANKESALVITTANKSSLAIGYCILGGDIAGTLAPLGDLWKTQVYGVAKYINMAYKRKHKKVLIPIAVIEREPTMELRPKQKDSDEVPPYDVMDKILQFYIAHRKNIHEIAQLGFDAELVRRIALMVQRSQFKRESLPVSISISSRPLWSMVLPVVSRWRG
jgi:NAD+ synthase (glutamine-hydrolysing)